MSTRLDRLRAAAAEPLLVSSLVNVRYLTDFESSNAALLVERERVRLFTDFRYAEAARAVAGVEVVETRRDLYGHLAELLSGRILVEADHLTLAQYETLRSGGVEPVASRGLVEGLREVKEPAELDAIGRAAAITSETFERLARERFLGRTEKELAWWIECCFHELGADGPAFPVIVAAGANAALPHATPGERAIERGQTVIVDAGARTGGYCSDCTRTFVTGELPAELRAAYEVCARAQEAGLEAAVPGASGVEADRAARRVIEEAGLAAAFGHGLGHGVGLEIHEDPRLSPESQSTLREGNVVTVEPGIYLPGLGGVRIEDLVVVRAGGPEVLTTFPKGPVLVD